MFNFFFFFSVRSISIYVMIKTLVEKRSSRYVLLHKKCTSVCISSDCLWWILYILIYPIQYCSPALHCDTLEHSQHGKADIIKTSYAPIRPFPFFQTHTRVIITYKWTRCFPRRIIRVAWCLRFTFLNRFS